MPTGNGISIVISAKTGQVTDVLHDEMLLTDIRTGIGGAIASCLLARPDASRLLIVGTGVQEGSIRLRRGRGRDPQAPWSHLDAPLHPSVVARRRVRAPQPGPD